MKIEEARQRIESAMTQYGAQAGMAIDLVINEVRSDLGAATANELIDEFDLELQYNIAPLESDPPPAKPWAYGLTHLKSGCSKSLSFSLTQPRRLLHPPAPSLPGSLFGQGHDSSRQAAGESNRRRTYRR